MVYEEYQDAYRKLTDTTMDCLSTEDQIFATQLAEFMKLFEEFDNRMSTIILKAFQMSNTTLGAFKVGLSLLIVSSSNGRMNLIQF
ncbi:hypothetical protein P879_11177 [Paragonimus westermani]|uniref:Dynein heavy chain tail domain-containing protein n=1 Tax=Paragonimus westermani TaxID=34504 RepID=A0A8T0DA74_9TREM|nr:hypothetical protein P879_11177 [Paragonimus westermani]